MEVDFFLICGFSDEASPGEENYELSKLEVVSGRQVDIDCINWANCRGSCR